VVETFTEMTIVMEYVEGVNIFQWLLDNKFYEGLPEPTACVLFKKICEAMKHIHDRGILHRDIKLDNILIYNDPKTRQPRVKLIDFGLSAILYPE
jgi:serine/threonine protein kinase